MIIVREILVTVIRFWVIEHGVIAASRGGKAKTLAQTIAITMYLVSLPQGSSIDELWSIAQRFAMGIALILTVVTALQYIKQARLLRRRIHGDLQ